MNGISHTLMLLCLIAFLSCNSEKELNDFFGTVDSSNIINGVACWNGIYALISDKYLLQLPTFITLNGHHHGGEVFDLSQLGCTLYIFEDHQANLANRCTDIAWANMPQPIEELYDIDITGKLNVFFSDDYKYPE